MREVYLSGEIHTSWRSEIIAGCEAAELAYRFTSPVTNHDASDAAGDCLGQPNDAFWRDHQSARVNALRNQGLLRRCDMAVVRFGEQYKQWNAAFDAGLLAALNKPFITLHAEAHNHALKEINAAAMASARSVEHVIELLRYVAR